MTDDLLRELGKQLPYDRPDDARRDAVRSSLLVEATLARPSERRRWVVVGVAFASGALAAAAITVLVLRNPTPNPTLARVASPAQVTASSEARLEHHVEATATGVDEVISVHDGKVRLAVAEQRAGDHVRLRTRDAEVEGTGVYEVVVLGQTLSAVSVQSGKAEIRVHGQRTVLLATGQTWRASVITTDLSPTPPVIAAAPVAPDPSASTLTQGPDTVTNPNTGPDTNATTPDATATTMTRPDTRSATWDTSVARPDGTMPDGTKPDTTTTRPDTRRTKPDTATAKPDTSGARPDTATAKPDTSGARPDTTVAKPDATKSDATKPDTTVRVTDTPGATRPETAKPDATKPDNAVAKRGASDIERRFKAGWSLLRAGKAREAADELGAAADAAPNDPLAADARYFQAVALVRAGERLAAEKVLLRFLDNAPRSLRRGRAAVLLGRLIGERGDVASARAWLESALNDPDPAIANAARAGIEALAKNK